MIADLHFKITEGITNRFEKINKYSYMVKQTMESLIDHLLTLEELEISDSEKFSKLDHEALVDTQVTIYHNTHKLDNLYNVLITGFTDMKDYIVYFGENYSVNDKNMLKYLKI